MLGQIQEVTLLGIRDSERLGKLLAKVSGLRVIQPLYRAKESLHAQNHQKGQVWDFQNPAKTRTFR